MEGRPGAQPVRTHPALSGLLQLQTGATYGVAAASLAALLMAGPSADGAWCAVVGAPEWGLEAAATIGVDLSRVVTVPDPGPLWVEVVAALVDVLGLVVVRPPASASRGPSAKDAARLAARLRTRGSILVVWGDWPRCEARLELVDTEWQGVGGAGGHGHLQARQATVAVQRGTTPAVRRRLWFPDVDLAVREVVSTARSVVEPVETTTIRRVV
jgi:hypothetical protein